MLVKAPMVRTAFGLVHPRVLPGGVAISRKTNTSGSPWLGCVAHGAEFEIVSSLMLPIAMPLFSVTLMRSFTD